MRTVLIAAIAAIAAVLSATPYAQAQAQKSQLVLMRIPDSKKDAEIHISKLLLEKLSVNTSLHSPKDKPDDMVVRASFDASEEQGTPAIVMLIDTKIVQRNKEGKPLAQVISISSFADVKVHDDKKGDILAWVNNLNRQLVPMRSISQAIRLGSAETF